LEAYLWQSILKLSLFSLSSPTVNRCPFVLSGVNFKMADRQAVQQNINNLLSKLDDADPDMRYMSLNDLYGVLSGPNTNFLPHDQYLSTKLAEGLLKALDDQHGDVQNQALKW
jgi:hypothetical protein